MPFPILPSNSASSYFLTKSLRFRSSASAYLSRTFGTPTNNLKWTFSGWLKRGLVDSGSYTILGSALGGGSTYFVLWWSGNQLQALQVTGGSVTASLITAAVYSDPAAWYHVTVVYDSANATASNRILMYVNGVQVTSFSTSTYPSLNLACSFNQAGTNVIGSRNYASDSYFDGYMTEFNFIDGQALTPSSFGSTNSLTGVWQPAKYTGTYGTNGFYLPFTNTTSTTTLGYDFSGNSNNWTTNNISLTAGSTYDSMTDVPTLTSSTVANYCVLNPLLSGVVLQNGNLALGSSSGSYSTSSTFYVNSGKWYWEVINLSSIGGGLGITIAGASNTYLYNQPNCYGYYYNGQKRSQAGGNQSYGASYGAGDTIGIALNMDAGTITFYKNNVSQGIAYSGLSGYYCPATDTYPTGISFNFGQQPYIYTPPTGFVALNTYNLPTSTIVKGNTVMDATLYTGTLLSNAITNTAGFKPDLVWIKSRSAATDNKLTDSVRGTTKGLISNTTGAETTDTQGLTAFGTNGFTVGTNTDYNNLTATYVGWQWQAGQGSSSSNTSGSITSTVSVNASAGFSVVTYTGNATNGATVGHGLGVTPAMIITKVRSTTGDWYVWQTAMGDNFMRLNTTAVQAASTANGVYNTASFSSSVFALGSGVINGSGSTFVSYCWAEIAGFSKFGSYTGNGNSIGPFVPTGFRPKFIMVKRSDSAADWQIIDTPRQPYNNSTNNQLRPNSTTTESTSGSYYIDIFSNGFIDMTGASTNWNTNTGTYIYMAFAENPFKYALAR